MKRIIIGFLLIIAVFSTTAFASENGVNDYEINGIAFSVPAEWLLIKNNESMAIFRPSQEASDYLLIWSEKIPSFMKIDLGSSDSLAVVDKQSLVKYFSRTTSDEAEIEKTIWSSVNGLEYCEEWYAEKEGKIRSSITIPIDINEAGFHAFIEYDKGLNYSDVLYSVLKSVNLQGGSPLRADSDVKNESNDIAQIMSTLKDLPISTKVQYSEPIMIDDIIAYQVKYGNSEFTLICNPNNDGKFTVGAMPSSLDTKTGSSELFEFNGYLAQAVSGSHDTYAMLSHVTEAIKSGSCTYEGITYELVDGMFIVSKSNFDVLQ